MDLKDLRLERRMTQKELGAILGVSQQYVSKLENGNINRLTLGILNKLSKVLKIEESELLKILRQGEECTWGR